jgi:hypothetical protein
MMSIRIDLYYESGSAIVSDGERSIRVFTMLSLPGLDLVIEGKVARVTDEATLLRLAERYAAQGWPATVDDGALTSPYSAPSAGPPPWGLYAITPITAFGVATVEPNGATRWRFD